MPKKRSEHYVNNKDLLDAMVEYRIKCRKAKEKGAPPPPISNYLGDCFLKIATHLSYKPNFVNYMFKDDMICDGIENCVRYIHNFDNLRVLADGTLPATSFSAYCVSPLVQHPAYRVPLAYHDGAPRPGHVVAATLHVLPQIVAELKRGSYIQAPRGGRDSLR